MEKKTITHGRKPTEPALDSAHVELELDASTASESVVEPSTPSLRRVCHHVTQHWNQSFKFNDIEDLKLDRDTQHCLHVDIFDTDADGETTSIASCRIPCYKFRDRKPHRAWHWLNRENEDAQSAGKWNLCVDGCTTPRSSYRSIWQRLRGRRGRSPAAQRNHGARRSLSPAHPDVAYISFERYQQSVRAGEYDVRVEADESSSTDGSARLSKTLVQIQG